MRRVLIILAFVIVTLIAALAALFTTPPGRRILSDAVESRLTEAMGGPVRIGALAGAPPGRILLTDVSFADERGTWLTIERADLNWRPLDLIYGRIAIDALFVDGALIERRPHYKQESRPFRLPERLPQLSIGRLEIRPLTVGASPAGAPIALRGGGRVAMGGAQFAADLSFASAEAGDKAAFRVSIDPHTDLIDVFVDIASPADGAITALAGLGGAVSVKAAGAGPSQQIRIQSEAAFGAVGALQASVTGDLKSANTLAVIGEFRWGSRYAAIAKELGPRLAFDVVLRRTPEGYAADLRQAATENASANGTLSALVDRRGAVASASAAINVQLAAAYRSELQALLGGDARTEATAERRGAEYAVAGSLEAPRGVLRFIDGARRNGALSALVDVDLKPSATGPLFARAGLQGRGRLTRATNGVYALDDTRIRAEGLGAYSGRAEYAPKERRFAINGKSEIAQEAVTRFAPWIGAGAWSAEIDAQGDFDDYAAKIRLQERGGSPSRIAAELGGLPHAPRGAVRFARSDGLSAEADFDTPAPGVIRSRTISARKDGFVLDGSAAYRKDDGGIDLDLRYAAATPTVLARGFIVEGAGKVAGKLALRGNSAIEATASSLALGGAKIDGLEVSARGKPAALKISAEARDTMFGALLHLRSMRLEASADLTERTAAISALSATAKNAPLRLVKPATAAFSRGISLRSLSLAVGERGSVEFDGEYSARHWAAKARGANLTLSDAADASADFDFDLDTDRPAPGAGRFRIASPMSDGAPFEIGGVVGWDGRRLRINDSGANSAFYFTLDAPAQLQRRASLALDRDGAISGAARFSGPVETIADFLPRTLQTLEGHLDASASLSGTAARPSLSGALTLKNGTYTELASGVTIASISAEARAEPAASGSALRFSAIGRGVGEKRDSIRFSGLARIGADTDFEGTLSFQDAALTAEVFERAVVTGIANMKGSPGKLALSGDLDVKSLDYRLRAPRVSRLRPIEIRAVGSDAPEQFAAPQPRTTTALDIRLSAANGVRIEGRGLDSFWKANVSLAGPADEPLLNGRLDLQRGTIDFSGRRFAMTRGAVIFDRLSRNDPSLDLRAERRTRDGVLAVITVKGRASAPEVELASVPAAPQEDVTALVLFGKRAVELTGAESLQAAQALARLSGVGGGAARAFGLDMLNVDFDTESGAGAVAVGKTLARGLFVSARQDVRGENGSVRVEYGVTDAFSVETEIKQTGDQTVSANWKKDF